MPALYDDSPDPDNSDNIDPFGLPVNPADLEEPADWRDECEAAALRELEEAERIGHCYELAAVED